MDPSVWVTVNPAVSSSAVETETVWSERLSKLSFELSSTTAIVIVVVCDPSIRESSTPVTVTVCELSQFPDVNVKVAGETVTSPVSEEVTEITTSEMGCASRTTVKSSVVEPSSATVVVPPDSMTVNPATSLSVVATDTVWSATPSKSSSELPSTTERVTVDVWDPSTRSSLAPVSVTVFAISQSAAVNVRVAGEAVASPVSYEVTEITTSDAGSAFRTTEIVSVVPVSSTSVAPRVSVMVNPAASSSVVVTDNV